MRQLLLRLPFIVICTSIGLLLVGTIQAADDADTNPEEKKPAEKKSSERKSSDRKPVGTGPLKKVATLALGGKVHGVCVKGKHAYVTTSSGLTVLDISDPAKPKKLGSASAAGGNLSVAVSGNHAFIAYRGKKNGGVRVIDVSNPSAPKLVGKTPVIENAWDVAIKDKVMYVVNFNNEMYLFDISSPASPKQIKKIMVKNAGFTTGVLVDGNRMIVSGWEQPTGMFVYDVSNASNPVFKGQHYAPFILQTAVAPGSQQMFGLGAYKKSYSGTHSGVMSGLWKTPRRGGTIGSGGYLKSPGSINKGGIAISENGKYVFEVSGDGGSIRVVDVSSPKSMKEVVPPVTFGSTGIALAEIVKVVVRGDYIFVGGGQSGFHVFHFSKDSAGTGRADAKKRKED